MVISFVNKTRMNQSARWLQLSPFLWDLGKSLSIVSKTLKMKEHELTKKKRTKKRYDLLPRSFSGYWYISSLQSTSYACMHNEGRESNAARASQGKTRNFGTWYTVASFLFCICMHTYKMKVPPQKDIYIQLSQWETLQWLWNSNSAGRDLAFLFSCYLFFESITIFKRGEGGAAYGLEVGVEVFWLVLFFCVLYNSLLGV